MEAKSLENKNIVLIVAPQDFRDEELFIPRSIFLAEGATVKIASSKKGEAIGSYGGVIGVDLTLEELKVSDFEGIIFIGGSGATKYVEDERCHQIATQALSQGKVLGAICIAPLILARSGVLRGKKATVWSSPLDKSAIKILEKEGVEFQKDSVVVDGKIVTANGPLAARKFAQALLEILK